MAKRGPKPDRKALPEEAHTEAEHLDAGGDPPTTVTRRRVLQGTLGTTAAVAAGPALIGRAIREREAGALGQGPPGRRNRRPNILFLTCDQNRYPPVYESAQVRAWRQQNLRTQNALMANGMNFNQYHCSTSACAPARTTMYTGQYPSLHGVSQVTGAAKADFDPDMFWLTQYTVPTLGNYLRAGGYRCIYKGKGHFATQVTPIEPGTKTGMLSFDANTGVPDPERERLYLEQNVLSPFGFDGWIGPEPHGANPHNSGSSSAPPGLAGRDQVYANEAVEIIKALDANRRDRSPWFLVASFVNPHDISTVGTESWVDTRVADGRAGPCSEAKGWQFTVGPTIPPADQLFDNSAYLPSFTQDLSAQDLPVALKSYRDAYHEFLTGIPDIPHYLRYYYQLVLNVDNEMWKVYSALKASRFYRDTIVILWSDHGELLSSHGDMHEKWHQSFQESARIPLMISNPVMFPSGVQNNNLVTQVDVVPTVLGLCGLEEEALRETFTQFTDPQPLVGRDLSGLVKGTTPPSEVTDPVYYYTEDEISVGLDQDNWYGFPYNSVIQPNNVETVFNFMDGKLWRLSRFYENPQYWSDPSNTPGCGTSIVNGQLPKNNPPGTYTIPVQQVVKTSPEPDQWEMYNITDDPTELHNLYNNPAFAGTQSVLADMLSQLACEKRLQPNVPNPWTEVPPGAPVCT
jgi:choline-sulfatase